MPRAEKDEARSTVAPMTSNVRRRLTHDLQPLKGLFRPSVANRPDSFQEARPDTVRDKSGYVTSVSGNFLDQATGNVFIPGLTGQKHRFQAGQVAVHQRHRQFVGEVRTAAQALHHRARTHLLAEVDQQAVLDRHHGDAAGVTQRSVIMLSRVSRSNIGFFDGLVSTATTTSSNSPAARRITSTWPLVTGSKLPGQTQREVIPEVT